MKLKLVRTIGTAGFTEGKLYVDDEFECFTVEDADRKLESGGVKIQNKTAIPRGTYNVTITMSNRFKRFLPLVEDVEGFEGIRIHSGNSSKDTEGCIIVGAINESYDDDWVGASKVAFDRLFPKIKSALSRKQKVTLEVA